MRLTARKARGGISNKQSWEKDKRPRRASAPTTFTHLPQVWMRCSCIGPGTSHSQVCMHTWNQEPLMPERTSNFSAHGARQRWNPKEDPISWVSNKRQLPYLWSRFNMPWHWEEPPLSHFADEETEAPWVRDQVCPRPLGQ